MPQSLQQASRHQGSGQTPRDSGGTPYHHQREIGENDRSSEGHSKKQMAQHVLSPQKDAVRPERGQVENNKAGRQGLFHRRPRHGRLQPPRSPVPGKPRVL